MKIRIMSDIHMEFAALALEPAGEDVLVLAGDIGVFTDGALWARDYARRGGVPVVMVAGNHEFYNSAHRHHTVESTLTSLRVIAASEPLLTFLEDDVAIVAGSTFIGCTLWTDYALNGPAILGMLAAQRLINDHRTIRDADGRLFMPTDALRRHEFSVGVLRERLPHRFAGDGPVVVVTHHLPSARSVNAKYGAADPLNAAFASNLDALVEGSGAALWVHGHTHDSADYRIGGTRVVCNPRGYVPRAANPAFDVNLIVEV